MREILTPTRQSALLLGLALAVVYTVGGWEQVGWTILGGAGLLFLWALCAAAGRADAAAEHAARTRMEALR